ncbi:MAG TPA: PQQ-dependent sugar dehydrogenase [Pyrinomonadaceae bacterium]|nr:PQQ-dependent sugar dehydrogenase [Pyrinomonadaceae bacterium]
MAAESAAHAMRSSMMHSMKIKVIITLLFFLIAFNSQAAQIRDGRAARFKAAAVSARSALMMGQVQRSRAQTKKPDRAPQKQRPQKLLPHSISLADGQKFDLNLPEGFDITVAAEGLKRVRFMALSPDRRVFVTDMYNLTDNNRGVVYILDDFDERKGKFGRVTPYLKGLRNPNSVAFYSDGAGNSWLYLALTDRLVRYRYANGDDKPQSPPEVLATFPDYGLSYKYGGWHLTRTISVGPNEKLYVSVGSSCNACEEKEEIRATVLEMEMDGRGKRTYARGLRNAVGIKWVDNRLFATNMGSDHLGNDKPQDTMYALKEGVNYGWPYCYQYRSKIYSDAQFAKSAKRVNCSTVPVAYAAFPAHSSPLGLEYFDSHKHSSILQNSFLVALHGSSDHRMGRGHSIVQVKSGSTQRDFVTGFIAGGQLRGRPVDVLQMSADSFLFTDDYAGVIYYVFRKSTTAR